MKEVTKNVHENQQTKSRASKNKTEHIKQKFAFWFIFATFKEQVDKLDLVELLNLFCIEKLKMKITFTFLESLGLETFPESYQKCSCEHHTNVDQRKLRHADILALCMLF